MSSGTILREIEVTDQRLSGLGLIPPGTPPDRGDDGQPPFGEPDRPPAIDAARLGMLIFLGAETMLFGGFIVAFLVFRMGAAVWPPPFQPRLPVEVTGVNTVGLLASGFTMYRALEERSRGDRGGVRRYLTWTAILGVAFLLVQGYEWARLIEFGLTATSGVYGGTFYTLIGAHAVHVLGALVWLSIILMGAVQGRYTAEDHAGLSVLAMYWTFVVALWPILYTLVYLV